MSKRLFGIISDKTGIPSALIVNNLNRSQAAQIAEARDENGKVIRQQAYSIQKSVNLNGITTASDPIDAGKQITIAGENYLVDQAAQNESNTAFVDVSISAVHSDKAAITQIGEILSESGNQTIFLSFITAGADQILSGYVGSDKDGNPVNGSIQLSQVTHGYNDDSTFYIIKITPGYLQDGYDNGFPAGTYTVNKNIVTLEAGLYESTEIVIPEAKAPTVNGNTVTIHPGYVTEETTVQTEGGAVSPEAGVLIDDNGVLKVQKLNFDGTTPSDGDIVEADKFYLFNTGKDEPDYGGGTSTGGSMEIYKCASVDSVNKTWSGYLYNTETKEFSDTLTEGLEYKLVAPVVGKCYNADATMLIDLYAPEGLVFYAPLTKEKGTDELGYPFNTTGNLQYLTFKGVNAAMFDGSSKITTNIDFISDIIEKDQMTVSVFVYVNSFSSFDGIIELSDSAGNVRSFGIFGNGNDTTKIYMQADVEEEITPDYTSYFGKWTNLLVTYNAGTITGYINGLHVGSSTYSGIANQTLLQIGGWHHGNLTGYLSQCKLWNRVLSAEEIKAEADHCLAIVTE